MEIGLSIGIDGTMLASTKPMVSRLISTRRPLFIFALADNSVLHYSNICNYAHRMQVSEWIRSNASCHRFDVLTNRSA